MEKRKNNNSFLANLGCAFVLVMAIAVIAIKQSAITNGTAMYMSKAKSSIKSQSFNSILSRAIRSMLTPTAVNNE